MNFESWTRYELKRLDMDMTYIRLTALCLGIIGGASGAAMFLGLIKLFKYFVR